MKNNVQTRALNAVRNSFDGRRRLRPWSNTHYGALNAAKAHPLGICKFAPGEGGTVSTMLNLKLAPVSGYMRSKAYVDMVQVYVPYQGVEKLELDTQEDAGVTEMTKRRLTEGTNVGMEDEGTITKAANIHPKSVGGAKRVDKSARLAYLAAVNHLRKSAYYAAQEVTKTETAILPAIFTANVLDPERLIDGAINLTGELPVKGISKETQNWGGQKTGHETGNDEAVVTAGARLSLSVSRLPNRPSRNDPSVRLLSSASNSVSMPHAASAWPGLVRPPPRNSEVVAEIRTRI